MHANINTMVFQNILSMYRLWAEVNGSKTNHPTTLNKKALSKHILKTNANRATISHCAIHVYLSSALYTPQIQWMKSLEIHNTLCTIICVVYMYAWE